MSVCISREVGGAVSAVPHRNTVFNNGGWCAIHHTRDTVFACDRDTVLLWDTSEIEKNLLKVTKKQTKFQLLIAVIVV